MTPQTQTTATEGKTGWASLEGNFDGERLEFLQLSQVLSGTAVTLTLLTEPEFDASLFHGKFSVVEFDARCAGDGKAYRVAVSGARLASALAALKPTKGSTVVITPTGDGRERTWTAAIQSSTT